MIFPFIDYKVDISSMKFNVKIPGRINVLGNPSDANEGAHQTISAAVNLWGDAHCEPADTLTFEMLDQPFSTGGQVLSRLEVKSSQDLKYNGELDLAKAAVNILLAHSPEFQEKYPREKPVIRLSTEIPRQSGLGGSTVLLLLTLVSLVRFYNLNRKRHNYYVLGEMTQRAEEKELGITCGFADRYVPLFGDIAYLDYRGKLFHNRIYEEPFVTYEKLGAFSDHLPLVLVFTGVQHNSGDVHSVMRKKYLEEYAKFSGDYEKGPPLVKIMKQVGDTAWKGKIELLEGEWERFGELMNENHRLVDRMMHYCGFKAGAGEANNRMIQAGLDAGALGAKLTGAGGGGSVFMLTRPGKEQEMADTLTLKLEQYGYENSQVFIPSVARQGVVILDIP